MTAADRSVTFAAIAWHVHHSPLSGHEVDTSARADEIRAEKRRDSDRQLHAAVAELLAAEGLQISEEEKAGSGSHPAPAQ